MAPSGLNCIIGHTGFVGSTLKGQLDFSHFFNSSNIDCISSAPAFDMTVCAAAPGSMLEANRNPAQDLAKLETLMDRLDTLDTRRFVLVSTIAVLADFAGGPDESTARYETELAYGRNRRALEAFCAGRFANCLTIRLPALYGKGLKKNFIFDLLNPVPSLLTEARLNELRAILPVPLFTRLANLYFPGSLPGFLKLDRNALNACEDRHALERELEVAGCAAVGFHNPATTYQYYDMRRLWSDIGIAIRAGLTEMHLATEPLAASEIYKRLTDRPMPESQARIHREDMHTRHANLWGRSGSYLETADVILEKLKAFYERERAAS